MPAVTVKPPPDPDVKEAVASFVKENPLPSEALKCKSTVSLDNAYWLPVVILPLESITRGVCVALPPNPTNWKVEPVMSILPVNQ